MLGKAYCKGVLRGGKWSKDEKHFHINVLALLALKLAILTDLTIHVQVDNIALASTTLSLKDGWYPQSIAFKIQQANWELSIIPLDHHYSKLQSTFQAS